MSSFGPYLLVLLTLGLLPPDAHLPLPFMYLQSRIEAGSIPGKDWSQGRAAHRFIVCMNRAMPDSQCCVATTWSHLKSLLVVHSSHQLIVGKSSLSQIYTLCVWTLYQSAGSLQLGSCKPNENVLPKRWHGVSFQLLADNLLKLRSKADMTCIQGACNKRWSLIPSHWELQLKTFRRLMAHPSPLGCVDSSRHRARLMKSSFSIRTVLSRAERHW